MMYYHFKREDDLINTVFMSYVINIVGGGESSVKERYVHYVWSLMRLLALRHSFDVL